MTTTLRKPRTGFLGLLALGALLALPAAAEAQQQRGSRGNRAQMEEQLRERFEAIIVRELGLDEATGEQLGALVEEFREPRRELGERQRMLQRRMAGTGALLSEDEAAAVLQELVEVKEEEVRLLAQEQAALLEILTPPQVVRLYTLREQFAQRIRQLRERPRGGGPLQGDGSGLEFLFSGLGEPGTLESTWRGWPVHPW